ncbi:MAG: acyltransferase [Oscillospiraceae bacterium]|nr:acyltransferase [Oscillospiraceae bacterium]
MTVSRGTDPAMRPRLRELDFLRCLAMLGVLTIHVTSTFLDGESRVRLMGMNLAFLLNQVARFAVPTFVFLSGWSLGLAGQPASWKAFWKKKVRRFLPPFLLWSLLYAFTEANYDPAAFLRLFRDGWWRVRIFLLGQAAPHLYYIPLLFQFYLLAPLLLRWVRKSPGWALGCAFCSTLLLTGWYILETLSLLALPYPPYLWMSAPLWLFYFVLGLWLARRPIRPLRTALSRTPVLPALLTAAFALLYCLVSVRLGVLDSLRLSLLLYTPLVSWAGAALWQRLDRRPLARSAVDFLAPLSMDIYFSHVLALVWLRRVPLLQKGTWAMLLLWLCTFLSALALSFGLGMLKRLVSRHKRHRAASL